MLSPSHITQKQMQQGGVRFIVRLHHLYCLLISILLMTVLFVVNMFGLVGDIFDALSLAGKHGTLVLAEWLILHGVDVTIKIDLGGAR